MTGDITERPAPKPERVVPYGAEPSQFGEIRLPSTAGPHPAIVTIHGGFWREKYGLDYFGHLADALTQLGFATWNIEYRRLGEVGGGWPGTFHDVAAATGFLFERADFFGIDPLRVSVLGHSAGGHLALWLAGLSQMPIGAPFQGMTMPLRSAISLGGVVNLHRAAELRIGDNVVADLLGGAPDTVPERYAAASPAALLPFGVPQLVVHGTADEDVPFEIGESYAAAAGRAGDTVTWLPLEGVNHMDIVDPTTEVWQEIVPAIVRIAGD